MIHLSPLPQDPPLFRVWPNACRLQFASPAPGEEEEEEEGLVERNPGLNPSSRLLPWAGERTSISSPATFQIHFNLLAWQQPQSHFALCFLPLPTVTAKHHQPLRSGFWEGRRAPCSGPGSPAKYVSTGKMGGFGESLQGTCGLGVPGSPGR